MAPDLDSMIVEYNKTATPPPETPTNKAKGLTRQGSSFVRRNARHVSSSPYDMHVSCSFTRQGSSFVRRNDVLRMCC